ncbi:ATP-binding cassette domain-containing protein [Terrihabitans sp. B22-R8]|uniref:ATP-binding cassette domain-containing protein n=1 Tax=Terrihabitans sp. B22-R8 TaxID=3425128 RepID=UPI00403C50BE
MPAALSVTGVSHAYGRRAALDDVSFAIEAGTHTVLLGLNGAGKSTLFALITRLYASRRGAISIFGHDIGRRPGEALRRLGVVFQSRTLDLDLTLMQNLIYHAALHGIGGREARTRAEEVLDKVALARRGHEKARSLSGGQMRRLEIARALLHRPELLLLDEPTVGLDIDARADILAHVRRLVAEERLCTLWATHLVDEIEDRDGVLILHEGRLLAHGRAGDIAADMAARDIRSAFLRLTGATKG